MRTDLLREALTERRATWLAAARFDLCVRAYGLTRFGASGRRRADALIREEVKHATQAAQLRQAAGVRS